MKSLFSKHHGLIAAILLTLFTGYTLLDVFVIPHEYGDAIVTPTTAVTTDANSNRTDKDSQSGTNSNRSDTDPSDPSGNSGNSNNSDDSGNSGNSDLSEPVITDTSYRDNNISITITEYRICDTNVYVADVTVSSPEYLYAAFAKDKYGRNIKESTSTTAERTNAILAINGDFYGARNNGYVIRNGVLYRKSSSNNEDLAIYKDGHMEIVYESKISAQELLDDGAVQVWSFGPGLLENGEITVSAREEVGRAMASNPRTAIAQVGENHYLFVVSDGRTSENDGLTLYELAEFLQSLGAETAYNLDGGGSSTMVFLGEVINNPTTNGRNTSERSVSDIVCIGYRN